MAEQRLADDCEQEVLPSVPVTPTTNRSRRGDREPCGDLADATPSPRPTTVRARLAGTESRERIGRFPRDGGSTGCEGVGDEIDTSTSAPRPPGTGIRTDLTTVQRQPLYDDVLSRRDPVQACRQLLKKRRLDELSAVIMVSPERHALHCLRRQLVGRVRRDLRKRSAPPIRRDHRAATAPP